MQPRIPQHPAHNPALPDGLYGAVIRDIRLQRSFGETQILLLFYLPEHQMHLVTRLPAPKRSYNRQDHRRLMDFCSAINVDISHILSTPAMVKGRRLRIKTKRSTYDSDGTTHWFSDIVGFLLFGTEPERNTELGMAMVPHSGLAD